MRRSQFFASVTKDETRRALEAVVVKQPRLPSLPALKLQQERIDDIYENTDALVTSDVVTLSDVTMVWNSGDGLKLETMRLNLDAIAAWWIAPGQVIKGTKDTGGFWAVGVGF